MRYNVETKKIEKLVISDKYSRIQFAEQKKF